MKISTEYSAEDAIRRIEKMVLEEDLHTFMVGEERKTVIAAAEARMKEIVGARHDAPKKGEQGPITQDVSDFKDGIQKTKNYVTCEDVIRRLREKGVKI